MYFIYITIAVFRFFAWLLLYTVISAFCFPSGNFLRKILERGTENWLTYRKGIKPTSVMETKNEVAQEHVGSCCVWCTHPDNNVSGSHRTHRELGEQERREGAWEYRRRVSEWRRDGKIEMEKMSAREKKGKISERERGRVKADCLWSARLLSNAAVCVTVCVCVKSESVFKNWFPLRDACVKGQRLQTGRKTSLWSKGCILNPRPSSVSFCPLSNHLKKR